MNKKLNYSKYLKLVLSVSILVFIVCTQGFSVEILQALIKDLRSFFLLFLAFALNYVEFFIAAVRFHILILAQNMTIPFKNVLKWTISARFFESLSLASVGSDLVKIHALKKYYSHKSLLFSFVMAMVDKAFAFAALFLLSACIFLFDYNNINSLEYFLPFACTALIVSFLFFLVLLLARSSYFLHSSFMEKVFRIKGIGKILKQGFLILKSFKRKPAKLFSIIFLSIVNQSIAITSLLCVILASGSRIESVFQVFFILPIAFVGNLFGIFGGLGAGTVSIAFALDFILNIPNSYILVLASQAINTFARIPCALMYLKR